MAIGTIENLSTLNAMFKDQYASSVVDALPSYSHILSKVKFAGGSEKAGRALKQPIILSRVHGHTCLGSDDANTTLRAPTTAVNDVATVSSCAYVSRQFISQTVLARASGSAQSFVEATAYVVQNLTESMAHMLETQHLYGQDGLAQISAGAYAGSVVNGITFTNGVNVAQKAILIAQGEFADGVWVGSDGMPVEIYDLTGTLALATGVTGADPTYGIIFLDSVTGLTDPRGFKVFRAGYVGVEVPGLATILKNTGVLFGIDAQKKRLWQANQFAVNGPLTFNVCQQAISRAIGRGLAEQLDLHINPRVFATAIPDFATVRDLSSNVKSRVFTSAEEVSNLNHGAEKIKFFVAGHSVELVSNPMVKAGYAYGMEEDAFIRVGSTKQTFDLPGGEGVYFRPLESSAAVELRAFADECLFSRKLNGSLILTGLTY